MVHATNILQQANFLVLRYLWVHSKNAIRQANLKPTSAHFKVEVACTIQSFEPHKLFPTIKSKH